MNDNEELQLPGINSYVLTDEEEKDLGQHIEQMHKNREETYWFNENLYQQWKTPLDNLETMIEIATNTALIYSSIYVTKAQKENNVLFHALRTIHARCTRIANECLLLLKSGYSDGAFSRWRSIHELSTIGAFLFEQNDSDLCERYIFYHHIQEYKDEKCNREQGHQEYTDEAYEALKKNYNLIIDKYGKDYKNGSYGWANDFFGHIARFDELEKAAKMDHLRCYYKSSCTQIHGNHKANQVSLGLMPNTETVLLFGPSNYGLSLPLQNTAISLLSITNRFLSVYPNKAGNSSLDLMEKLLIRIRVDADSIQTAMEKEQL